MKETGTQEMVAHKGCSRLRYPLERTVSLCESGEVRKSDLQGNFDRRKISGERVAYTRALPSVCAPVSYRDRVKLLWIRGFRARSKQNKQMC